MITNAIDGVRRATGAPDLLDAYSTAVTTVYDDAGPSVVSIRSHRGRGRIAPDEAGAGSGVLIAPDGLIVTNDHVVDGARELDVVLFDGGSRPGRVLGRDRATDLAIIKVSGSSLPALEFGDSDRLRPGQLARDRSGQSVRVSEHYYLRDRFRSGPIPAGASGQLIEGVIQSDVALNPGNSGGPLLDGRARIVGINTAIIRPAQGLSFSIPSKTAAFVASELISHGSVRRVQLGIKATTQPITRRTQRAMSHERASVVVVTDVLGGSLAGEAGIRSGDFVLAVNEGPVANADDIYRLLAEVREGSPVTITVFRGDRRRTLVGIAPATANGAGR